MHCQDHSIVSTTVTVLCMKNGNVLFFITGDHVGVKGVHTHICFRAFLSKSSEYLIRSNYNAEIMGLVAGDLIGSHKVIILCFAFIIVLIINVMY